MKKIFKFAAVVLCAAATFASCEKEGPSTSAPLPVDRINGEYSSTKVEKALVLNYSGAIFDGKSAKFTAIDNTKATISVDYLLPGVPSTQIEVTLVQDAAVGYTFSGKLDIAEGTVDCTGSIVEGKLTLNVNASLKNELSATSWSLRPIELGGDWGDEIIGSGLHAVLESEKPFTIDMGLGFPVPMPANDVIKLMTGMKLFGEKGKEVNMHEMLANAGIISINFKADGNVTINMTEAGKEVETPLNLAFYFMKDGKVYLTLNLTGILNNLPQAPKTTAEGEITPNLDPLMGGLLSYLPMLQGGIEMTFSKDENGKAALYLDTALLKDLCAKAIVPFLKDETNKKFFEQEIKKNDSLKDSAPMFLPVIDQVGDVIAVATKFELGLNLNEIKK